MYIQEDYVGPVLTPAESIAAVRVIEARTTEVTRRVRGTPPGGGPEKPVDAHEETPEKIYESCMAQARSVEEPTRSVILESCERQRPR